MEFKPNFNSTPPKNLYPCLATITLGPSSDRSIRRMSGSAVSDDDGLKRVISGNRRKTSFGQVADRGDIRDQMRKSLDGGGGGERKSFEGAPAGAGGAGAGPGGAPAGPPQTERGTWYWRVQAGVTDTHLVLLPLSQPANPVLTSPPAPLSEVMPSHSTAQSGEHESLGTKVKNLFTGRRQSKVSTGTGTGHGTTDASSHDTDATAVNPTERVLDQTPGGDVLPSPTANAAGATNTNANAETGWPGFIAGEKLAAVMISLSSIDHAAVKLHEHKKEGTFVTVPVTAHLAGVGQTSELAPKSGFLKFEFDKDWIGAKGEAELLHHYITSAAQNPSAAPATHFANQNFQLGGGGPGSPRQAHAAGAGVGAGGLAGAGDLSADVAPDQSVSTASSGKVAGTV